MLVAGTPRSQGFGNASVLGALAIVGGMIVAYCTDRPLVAAFASGTFVILILYQLALFYATLRT